MESGEGEDLTTHLESLDIIFLFGVNKLWSCKSNTKATDIKNWNSAILGPHLSQEEGPGGKFDNFLESTDMVSYWVHMDFIAGDAIP